MKRLILVLLIFMIWMGCDTQADNDPQQLKLVFYYPKHITDIQRFDIYWWQGDDSTAFLQSNLQLISTVNPDSFISEDDSIYTYESIYHTVVLNYVGGGAKAVDDSGLTSDYGMTELHSYHQFFAPPAPINMRIER